jgi:hypothetical protein
MPPCLHIFPFPIEIEIFQRERQNPAMPEIFEHFHTVGEGEIDSLGHANNVPVPKPIRSPASAGCRYSI